MATRFTTIIAAAFPAAKARPVHRAMLDKAQPTGERFFNDTPTHADADGTEWVYVETHARPERATAFGALTANFPLGRFAIVGQVVDAADIDGREVVWRDKGRAMVRTQDRSELIGDLTRIETDDPL